MGSIQSVNIDAMLRYTFVPDYSVRAVTEVMYLRVKRSFYMAAKRATLMERSKKMSNAGEFDEEVDKVIDVSKPSVTRVIRTSPVRPRIGPDGFPLCTVLARVFNAFDTFNGFDSYLKRPNRIFISYTLSSRNRIFYLSPLRLVSVEFQTHNDD